MGSTRKFNKNIYIKQTSMQSKPKETQVSMPKPYGYAFTVFTSTYNRANLLHRVYDSLQAQTYKDFEWLIYDDGSTDHTENLVQEWKKKSDFPIHYTWQENRGKAKTMNRAVQAAKGELFLAFDSDDACIPEALERFKYHWDSIVEEAKSDFCGITALCVNQYGKIVGKSFPSDILVSNSIELQSKYFIFGEKWGCQKTDILQQFPFPEIPGERFIEDSIVWNKISLNYKTIFINEVLRLYYENAPDGTTTFSAKLRAENPKGAQLYYKEYTNLPMPLILKIKGLVNYIRFSLHGGIKPRLIIQESEHTFLSTIFFIVGFLIYKKDLSEIQR